MALPPIHVTQKTVKANLFSRHDNRHSFQTSGVYFGQGLGKKPAGAGKSQHLSDNYFNSAASISSGACTNSGALSMSTYTSDYHQLQQQQQKQQQQQQQGGFIKKSRRVTFASPQPTNNLLKMNTNQTQKRAVEMISDGNTNGVSGVTQTLNQNREQASNYLLQKFSIFSKPSFHRYPHTHRATRHASSPPLPILPQRAEWFYHTHKRGTTAPPTPLVVLAESQKPLLPHNLWAYSYKM